MNENEILRIGFEESGIELKIKKGDKILAGQTVATFTPMSSLSVAEKILEGPKRVLSKIKATASEGFD